MHAHKRRAFTLIELLVVIAIIALLMAVIVPALRKAKELAAAAVCLANQSQLGKAYMLYCGDNDSCIPDGDTSDRTGTEAGYETYNRSALGESSEYRVHCWVGRPMDENRLPSNDSLADKVRGFQAGSLWSYLEAPKVYHCPADNRSNTIDPSVGMLGYRSYSIGKVLSKRFDGTITAEVRCEISKLSQFVSPGNKIVFLEEAEREYGWNHRTWNMDLESPRWGDPFAIFHNDSSTFVFADGHADRHKWLQKTTKWMAEEGVKDVDADELDPPGTYMDYNWFKKVYIPGRRPPGI